MKFETKTVHKGAHPDPSTGAIMTPIYQTSTYVQEGPGQHQGYEYARVQNPTRSALEENIASLEEAKYGFAFSSGMSAIDAVLRTLHPGDEVIATNDLYGGTYRLFTQVLEQVGLKFKFVDTSSIAAIEEAVGPDTRMLWVETPTNPVLKVTDLREAARIAKRNNLLFCVDNTFSSPYLQQPLVEGADVVIHSATKFLGGHSDVVLGTLACNDDELAEQIHFIQKSVGATPGPQDSFLVLRGIKTLHVRMPVHCSNARAVVELLQTHPRVDKIHWPGLPESTNHEVAKQQMRDFGGMVSFTLKGDSFEEATKVLQHTQVFSLAESLGGVESLIGHPASMTHASIPKANREQLGISDSFIRLSVGIEHQEDLLEDLQQALDADG
jgi:cystathionine beta-lyase